MAKTKKKPALPFDSLAVALMIERHNPVKQAWKQKGFRNSMVDNTLSREILTFGIGGKADLALRQVLRNTIEAHPGFENSYLLRLEEAKKLRRKELEGGFSVDIKGAGTKGEIIDSLEGIIATIKSKTIEELEEGIEIECDDLVIKSGTFEDYAGYPIEYFKK